VIHAWHTGHAQAGRRLPTLSTVDDFSTNKDFAVACMYCQVPNRTSIVPGHSWLSTCFLCGFKLVATCQQHSSAQLRCCSCQLQELCKLSSQQGEQHSTIRCSWSSSLHCSATHLPVCLLDCHHVHQLHGFHCGHSCPRRPEIPAGADGGSSPLTAQRVSDARLTLAAGWVLVTQAPQA